MGPYGRERGFIYIYIYILTARLFEADSGSWPFQSKKVRRELRISSAAYLLSEMGVGDAADG